MDDKVRVVVRADLPVAAQAVQAAHAAMLLASELRMAPGVAEDQTIALLSVADESALLDLVYEARRRDIDYVAFYEPDLGDAITAIALAPGPRAKRLCRRLRRALQQQEDVMTT